MRKSLQKRLTPSSDMLEMHPPPHAKNQLKIKCVRMVLSGSNSDVARSSLFEKKDLNTKVLTRIIFINLFILYL